MAPQAAAVRQEPRKERTPRVDFRGVGAQAIRGGRARQRPVWKPASGGRS